MKRFALPHDGSHKKQEFHGAMKHPRRSSLSGREKRARRVRGKVSGTAARPRISVYRSLNDMYVQLIDDVAGVSLVGVSSKSAELKGQTIEGGKIGVAKAVGKLMAAKAKEKGITEAVFDRSGYLYHGRVKAVAEGAREGGLTF